MSALLPSLGGFLLCFKTRHGLRARTALKLRTEDCRSGGRDDQEGGLHGEDGDAGGDGVAPRHARRVAGLDRRLLRRDVEAGQDRQSPSALISSTPTLSTRAPLIVRSGRFWAAS
jgi:hypothetical protein